MIGTFHSMLSRAVKRIIRNCYLSLFFGVKRDRSVDYNLLTPVLMFQFYQLFSLILIFYPEDLTNQLDDLSILSVSTWHNMKVPLVQQEYVIRCWNEAKNSSACAGFNRKRKEMIQLLLRSGVPKVLKCLFRLISYTSQNR